MSPTVLMWITIGAVILGSIGGGLEKAFPEGSAPYRVGAFFASLLVDFVSLRKLGNVAIATAAFAWIVVLSVPQSACTPSQVAEAKTIDQYTNLLTNALCAVAPDVPVDGPLVTLVCQITEGVEAVVTMGIDGLPVVDGGTSVTGSMRLPVTRVYVQVPQSQAAGFLARHARRHQP